MNLSHRFRNVVRHGVPHPSGARGTVVDYFKYLDEAVSAMEDIVFDNGEGAVAPEEKVIRLREILNHGVPYPTNAPRTVVKFFELLSETIKELEAKVYVVVEEPDPEPDPDPDPEPEEPEEPEEPDNGDGDGDGGDGGDDEETP